MERSLIVKEDLGAGRPFVLIYDEDRHSLFGSELAKGLSASSRVVVIKSATVNAHNWATLVAELKALLVELKVRQASYVGFGGASAIAQALLLDEPKNVRTLALVDGESRPHPSRFSRFVDSIERRLPLGLPLRSAGQAFDSRPFLQRVRCPVLVVTTSRASAYELQDADVVADLVPTGWRVQIDANQVEEGAAKLCEALVLFQEVPAKCPQKNLGTGLG